MIEEIEVVSITCKLDIFSFYNLKVFLFPFCPHNHFCQNSSTALSGKTQKWHFGDIAIPACAQNKDQHTNKNTNINVQPQKWSVSLTLNIYKSKKYEIIIHLAPSPSGHPEACQLVPAVLTAIH